MEDKNKKEEASKKAAQEAKQYWDNVQKIAAEKMKAEKEAREKAARAKKRRRRLKKLNGVKSKRTLK